MIEKLIRQLESPDPKQRMKAIKALAKTGDRAALKPLLRVYKSDPDDGVRKLALKAGRYIKNKAGTPSPPVSTEPAPTSYYDDEEVYEDEYADDAAGYSYYDEEEEDRATYDDSDADDGIDYMLDGDTSHRLPLYADSIHDTITMPALSLSKPEKSEALSLLDDVENYKWRGQKDKAIETLSKAMQLDPKLWKNSYALGLVRSVTKLSPDEAYEMLMGDLATQSKKRKRKKARDTSSTFSWRGAFIDLVIFGVVSTILVLIPGLLRLDYLKDSFASAGNPQSLPLTQEQYNNIVEKLDDITPPVFVVIVLAYGAIASMVLFTQDIVIHLAARFVFSGVGTIEELIRKTTLFYTFAYPLIVLMILVRFWPGVVMGEQVKLSLSIAIGMAVMLAFFWSLKMISEIYR
jgi:tetratricopeptide (TPR) repeat protein